MSIIPMMQQADVQGRIVPWDDVLHEGPVPAGLGPAALRERRADFLAGCGWDARDQIARDLEARDRLLEDAAQFDEIVLWFEHDLYDQLHLLQILERLPVDGGPRLTAVAPATYLGQLPASDYPGLFESRRFVSSAERMAARDAWNAFRSADPRAIADVLPRVTVLPHLGPALQRHLEQFPSVRNGLSQTEQHTLEAVAGGVAPLREVFEATQRREEAFFMGDAVFLFHITSLIRSHRPLLKTEVPFERFVPSDQSALRVRLALTSLGASALSCESDRVELCAIDRWLGGVHLFGNGPVWRWDPDRRALRMM